MILSSRLRLCLAQIIVLLIFIGVGLVISLKMPLSDGRDELAHFRFVRFIAEKGHLPLNWEERQEADYKSEWPPMFHILAGVIGQRIDLGTPPSLKIAQHDPRVQLVIGNDNLEYGWLGRVLTTEDPLQGQVLLWYVGRWVALSTGVMGILATYLLISTVYPNAPWLALSAVGLFCFTPNYIEASTVIGYDPLLVLPIALYLLLLYYTVQQPTKTVFYLGLGILLGIAGLIKYTPLPAAIIVPLFVLWYSRKEKESRAMVLKRLGAFVFGLSIAFGWWVIYVELYFNRIGELGWIAGIIYPFLGSSLGAGDVFAIPLNMIISGDNSTGLLSNRGDATFFQWVWAILLDIWLQPWIVWIILGLAIIALFGFVRRWPQANQQTRTWLIVVVGHVVLFTSLTLLRFIVSGQADNNIAAGQHVLFPAGASVIILLIYGLRAWFTNTRLTILLTIIATIMLWQSLILAHQAYANKPLPIQTVPSFKEALAKFNELTLLDYQITSNGQVLVVTLQWQTNDYMLEDYRFELTVVDVNNQPLARWIGHPLNGRYPTRAWAPGDTVRDTIYLPLVGLSGNYRVILRALNEVGQLPLIDLTEELTQSSTASNENAFSLGSISLDPQPSLPIHTFQLGHQEVELTLWKEEQTSKTSLTFLERATLIVTTQQKWEDDLKLSLVDPKGERHTPIDHTGQTYNFEISPNLPPGPYHLHLELWQDGEMVAQTQKTDILQVGTFEREFEVGPMNHPLSANFADQLSLLGYDLPQRKVLPGQPLPITFYWQALKTMGANFIMFSRIIDQNQESWGGRDRIPREIYSTMFWTDDEVVTDPTTILIEPTTPNGIYHLLVGLYVPVGETAVSLPLIQNGQMTDVTHVTIGPFKVGATPSHFIVDKATPEIELNQPFGDAPNLTLLGYDLNEDLADDFIKSQPPTAIFATEKPSELRLKLYWQSETVLLRDYTTFVHVRDENNQTVGQKDQPPLNGAYPTSLWEPSEVIVDEIVIPLPKEIAMGQYDIVVGMYDFYTGQRLSVSNNSSGEVRLIKVEFK